MQYESLVSSGTEELIAKISKISGSQRSVDCMTSNPKQWLTKATNKTSEAWLNNYVDWSAEALIGYTRR